MKVETLWRLFITQWDALYWMIDRRLCIARSNEMAGEKVNAGYHPEIDPLFAGLQ